MPKVDNHNWTKTMENIVLHLNLKRGVRGAPLDYVVTHVKVAHISSGYSAYLNLNDKMTARVPTVEAKSNLTLTQECLYIVYLSYLFDALKIDNALVYHILSKAFTNMDAYVYMKQKKRICVL